MNLTHIQVRNSEHEDYVHCLIEASIPDRECPCDLLDHVPPGICMLKAGRISAASAWIDHMQSQRLSH